MKSYNKSLERRSISQSTRILLHRSHHIHLTLQYRLRLPQVPGLFSLLHQGMPLLLLATMNQKPDHHHPRSSQLRLTHQRLTLFLFALVAWSLWFSMLVFPLKTQRIGVCGG